MKVQSVSKQAPEDFVEECDLAVGIHDHRCTPRVDDLSEQFSLLLVREVDHEALLLNFLKDSKDEGVEEHTVHQVKRFLSAELGHGKLHWQDDL